MHVYFYNKVKWLSFIFIGSISILVILPIFSIFNISYNSSFINNYVYIFNIVSFTLWQALLSASISIILAIIFAHSLNRQRHFIGREIIVKFLAFMFVVPTMVIIFGTIAVYGFQGFINSILTFFNFNKMNSIYGLKGILLAHVLLNMPFATRVFLNQLETIPYQNYKTAEMLHFTSSDYFKLIEWPLMKQTLYPIFILIFILCFTSFSIILSLGGGPHTSTLEVAIYESLMFELNFVKASSLAIIQLIFTIILLTITASQNLNLFMMQGTRLNFNHPQQKIKRNKIFDFLIISVLSLFIFTPFIMIIFKSFINLYGWKIVTQSYFHKAFITSVIICILSGTISTTIAIVVSFLNFFLGQKNKYLKINLNVFTNIILGVSPIILGTGYFILLGELRYFSVSAYCILIMVNILISLPFSFLIIKEPLKNLLQSFNDLAIMLNLNKLDYLRVNLKPLMRFIGVSFAISSAISLGDMTVIALFGTDNFTTIPHLIFQMIGTYKFAEGSALTIILLSMSFSLFLFFDRHAKN